MVDIGIPVERQPENDVYNALCARTTFDSDDDTDGICTDRTECSAVQLEEELNGNINMVGENDIDLNDFLNFDSTANELWDVALEEVANNNWWGLAGNVNKIDLVPSWSRLNSPELEALFGQPPAEADPIIYS